jgi:hypothetical protein
LCVGDEFDRGSESGLRDDEDEDQDQDEEGTNRKCCETDSADRAESGMSSFLEDSSTVIQVPWQGLERAASSSDNDIMFIANGIELHCTQLEASFISQRVVWFVQQAKTINLFFVESRL